MSFPRMMSPGFADDARRPMPGGETAVAGWLLAALACVAQCGCTALVSTTALRDTVRSAADADDDASVAAAVNNDSDQPPDEPLVLVGSTPPADRTIDEAIERLAATGRLDEATQAALVSMLEQAPQGDWPAIIDAFIDALDASHVVARPVVPQAPAAAEPAAAEPPSEVPPAVEVVGAAEAPPPAVADSAAVPDPPRELPVAEKAVPLVFPTPDAGAATPASQPVIEPTTAVVPMEEPALPGLVVANACFATRVRGWGAVDRFETARFWPGQDVIVYFELENLESQTTTGGHATRVDTALRLVADDGRVIHEWSFDPVEEICPARRRDYFLRYVLRLPADLHAGACRLEVAVSDVIGDRTAATSLPLEIADQ